MAKRGDKPQKIKEAEENTSYIAPISEKVKLINKMQQAGYKCEFNSSGIPMFRVNSNEEIDEIRKEIDGRFSFGYFIETEAENHGQGLVR